MVPPEGFGFKHQHRETGEDGQGNHFLNNFELNQGKRSAVVDKTDSVGRNLKAVLEKSHNQLIRITENKGKASKHLTALNFRWPYQARVINPLEKISSSRV